ncbi:MAG: DUF115 domain-containing protein, partial [Lentisphaerae bacterium]|nr:DUF115 domain-containing protein [Lentisphaerota bacterium]
MNTQPSLVRSLPVNCRVALAWPASDDDVAAILQHCTGLKRLYVVKQPGDPRPPSSLLGNPCIRFVTIADERAVREVLPPLFEKDNLAFVEGRVGVGIDERRRQAAPEFCRRLESCVLDFTRDMVASAAFRCTHGWHVLENMVLNLDRIRRESTLESLFDRASGRPVVIVGAGPSLDKNIGVLASFMDRVTIVACDAAWPMLMRAGVTADLVVTLDDGDLVWRFFAPIPAELQANTGLVGILSSNWHVMRTYRGPIFFGRYDKPMDRQIEKALNRSVPLVDGGQCVGHAAFELARLMGADPIVMVGFDLAYSDNRFYSKSMEVPIFEALEPPPENMVSVEGIDGKPVRTEISFLMYLREFERRIARCGRQVWDATEGGARKAGTRIVDLKTALTESLGAATAAKPRVTELAAKTGADAGRPQLDRWRKSAEELTLKIREALCDGLLMEREPAPYPFLSPHEELLDLVSSVINPCLMAELFWAWDDWVTDRQGIVQ